MNFLTFTMNETIALVDDDYNRFKCFKRCTFGTVHNHFLKIMAAYGKSENPRVQLDGRSLGLPAVHQSGQDEFLLDIADVNTEDVDELLAIFEEVLKDGQSYPQESITRQSFIDYFFGQYTFVVRQKSTSAGQKGKVVAGFYIKSNFPGRSSHLANYGIMVHSSFRGKGLANFMVEQCVRLAPLVGFKALYTNLVYTTNIASIKTCQKYGFTQVGRVPKAGLLKGFDGYVDALQFYKDVSNED